MLISRGTNARRALNLLKLANGNLQNTSRNSHQWTYRAAPPPPAQFNFKLASAVQGVAWWWVLWHLWTEPAHITGEFEYPDASKWSDEELGIPSD